MNKLLNSWIKRINNYKVLEKLKFYYKINPTIFLSLNKIYIYTEFEE